MTLRLVRFALPLVLAAALTAPAYAHGPSAERTPFGGIPGYWYVNVDTRPGVTQGFLLIEPRHYEASVILFVGDVGNLGLGPDGVAPFNQGNFLMRTRDLFAAQALRVAIIDAPSDRPDLFDFRDTPEHAQDVAGVIAYLRHTSRTPVWLVGTSRGTVSVAYVASVLHGPAGPDGVVFTSSLLLPGGGDPSSVFSADLGAITVPALVVHNQLDACFVTLFADVHLLVDALVNAQDLQLVPVTGGGPPSGDPCGAFHYHGYIGIEAKVAKIVGDYIHDHEHGHGEHRGWSSH
jgi:hypothetical protein